MGGKKKSGMLFPFIREEIHPLISSPSNSSITFTSFSSWKPTRLSIVTWIVMVFAEPSPRCITCRVTTPLSPNCASRPPCPSFPLKNTYNCSRPMWISLVVAGAISWSPVVSSELLSQNYNTIFIHKVKFCINDKPTRRALVGCLGG